MLLNLYNHANSFSQCIFSWFTTNYFKVSIQKACGSIQFFQRGSEIHPFSLGLNFNEVADGEKNNIGFSALITIKFLLLQFSILIEKQCFQMRKFSSAFILLINCISFPNQIYKLYKLFSIQVKVILYLFCSDHF